MKGRTVFCPECREYTGYSVVKKEDSAVLKGRKYKFISQSAFCDKAGHEVYEAGLEDSNLKALYDAYRETNGIISLEDIRAIPEKYNIGKRPLSLLLGWGELTLSRYCDGDIPTKQYSDILKKISSDPRFYLSLLEKNKDNLKSQKTYKKSRETVETLLKITAGERTKINNAVDYLLFRCRDISPLSLQKALYYVQGFYFAFFGTFLFMEECEAWVHGPVYPEVYRHYRNYCFDAIESPKEFDLSLISAEEKIILDSIVRHVCCYSGKTLEAFTHTEMPWMAARGALPADAAPNAVITKDAIGIYFSSIKEKYQMLSPTNIKDYMQDLFSQI